MDFPKAPLALAPHFSQRPWGGARLRGTLGFDVPADGGPYGEAWTLSDHPNGRSAIASGPLAGRDFGEVLRQHPLAMIGRAEAPARFPLLVKAIDAAEDLSIQVHPDDARAPAGDRGKTECWYVVDCEEDALVAYGLAPGTTLDDLKQAAADGSMEERVAFFPIEPGSFISVPAGTVHAILGGTLICEIQQSSDTTYRMWDWNRKPERELHLEESWGAIDLHGGGVAPGVLPPPGTVAKPLLLIENEFFRVLAVDVPPGEAVDLKDALSQEGGSVPLAESEAKPAILCCVAGGGIAQGPEGDAKLALGGCVFVPACCGGVVRIAAGPKGPLRVLVVESAEI